MVDGYMDEPDIVKDMKEQERSGMLNCMIHVNNNNKLV